MTIEAITLERSIGVNSEVVGKGREGHQMLGSAQQPLLGPVLIEGKTPGEFFWTNGSVGRFTSDKMIAELTLVDASGGVQKALRALGRQSGRGLDVYGGRNRNFFTVTVPSAEHLTEQGTVTFRARYHDGSWEDVTFHMAPPDSAKIQDAGQRLPGTRVIEADRIPEVLDAALNSGSHKLAEGGREAKAGIRPQGEKAPSVTGPAEHEVEAVMTAPAEQEADPVVSRNEASLTPSPAGPPGNLGLESALIRSQELRFEAYHWLMSPPV